MDSNWKRNDDDEMTLETPNGTATVSRTPDVGVATAREWLLELDGQFQETYETQQEALLEGRKLLNFE